MTALLSLGARTPDARVHDSGDRDRCRDVLAVHGDPGADERVPRARAERAARRAQGARVHVRVHRRDVQGLRVRAHAAARGRAHGAVRSLMYSTSRTTCYEFTNSLLYRSSQL